MIRVDNIDETIATLSKLNADTTPLWGGMTPQHMVEHLTMTLKASSGKMPITQRTTPEEAAVAKAKMIYSDAEIPQGLKSPLMGDGLPDYVNPDLQGAINELKGELQHFENYYRANPGATHIQPRMGALKHDEWVVFHSKHFTHHFKQFGLVELIGVINREEA